MLTLTDGMLLYHGSFTRVSQIDLDKCKAGKDFGRGFYVTSSYKQAQNFVPLSVNKQVKEGKLPPDTTLGYISVFKLHLTSETSVHLFQSADRDWLHFVASSRRGTLFPDLRKQYAAFDIIGGKIANDQTAALFSFILPVLMVNPVLNRQTASPSHCCYQIVWKTNSAFATEKSSSLSNS